jgi:hypothetical protein
VLLQILAQRLHALWLEIGFGRIKLQICFDNQRRLLAGLVENVLNPNRARVPVRYHCSGLRRRCNGWE